MTMQEISIAIVDDDPGVAVSLKRLLALYGYRPLVFSSAAECLCAIAGVEVACFLIDVELGGSSGIDLARKLSAMGVQSPVIHMSGARNDQYKKAALASGSIAFLEKPFSAELLIEAIEKAMCRGEGHVISKLSKAAEE